MNLRTRGAQGKAVNYPGGGNMNWDHHDAIYSTDNTNKPGASGAGRAGSASPPGR